MTHIISIANQKGGVGKTTTAINLGAGLNRLGNDVLLIDIDSQANATSGLGFNIYNLEYSLEDVLFDGKPIGEDVIKRVDGLDVLPAGRALAAAESQLREPGREHTLREQLDGVCGNYDYIIIDCPPSLGLLSIMAFTASTDVLVPLQVEYYSLLGLTQLGDIVDLIKKRLNPNLNILGYLCTMLDGRKSLHEDVYQALQEKFPDKIFSTVIRTNSKLAETPRAETPIYDYDPSGHGAVDFMNLSKEVVNRYE